MSILNSNNFLYKTVDDVKQFFSPLVNASTVVLKDGSRLEKDGKIYADQAVNAENAVNATNAENSAMLGGKESKYYIQPRNLLDNSDFTNPINQRGQTNYTGSQYMIDRWRMWEANHTLTINDGDITISGNMYQYVECKFIKNKTYTLAAMKTDGTIIVFSRNPYHDFASNEFGLGLGYDSNLIEGITVIMLQSGSYKWAALYEGEYTADNLPPYVPKGYAVELAECQRYFERFVANAAWHIFAFGAVTKSGNKATFQFNYAKKRIQSPTLNMSGNFCVIHDGTTMTPTSWTWSNANDNSMLIDAVITGVTLGKAVYIQARNDTSAYIDISADL